MKITNFTESSAPLNLKTLEIDRTVQKKFTDKAVINIFKKKLPIHFEDISFGNGVVEIFYYERALSQEHFHPIENLLGYSKKAKKIDCVVDFNYEEILKLTIPDFLKLLASKYLKISETFLTLNLTEFDIAAYVESLHKFFDDNSIRV